MKKLLTAIGLLISFCISAQVSDTSKFIKNEGYGYQYKRWKVDSMLVVPTRKDTSNKIPGQIKILDNSLYYTGIDGKWKLPGSNGTQSGTLAQIKALNTSIGSLYFTTDKGGGTWLDIGLKADDDLRVDDGATLVLSINNHWLQRQITDGVNVIWFGVSTTNDSTTNRIAAQKALDYAWKNGGTVYWPTGQYNIGYAFPLKLKGDGVVIRGDGSGTSEGQKQTAIRGRFWIGDTNEAGRAVRCKIENLGIFGPGVNDVQDTSRTSDHQFIGVTGVYGYESTVDNITVEGFKYGYDIYPDPTASIAQMWSASIIHSRFFNNRICGIAVGRAAHIFTIFDTNASYSDYNIVVGVFAGDTLVTRNQEPNFTINILSSTIQAARKTGIMVASQRKVTIRDCYFENGNQYLNCDNYIQIGSNYPSASPTWTGGRDEVVSPIISGCWFFTLTAVYTYKPNFACIRINRVNGALIEGNTLNNIPVPVVDEQMKDIYLIKNDNAILDSNSIYISNTAHFARTMYKKYLIKGVNYSAFHGTYTFSYLEDVPIYLSSNSGTNQVTYNGVVYNTTLLGGSENDNTGVWGMLNTDILKFPEVTKPVDFVSQ